MALKVIGAGWGRTGTESLKLALEQLGFDKCYHMFELIKDQSRFPCWLQLEQGQVPDYDALFKGYQSAVDFPAALYYRELMAQFPDAKVILTVRDADSWYESASKTILKGIPGPVLILARIFGFFSPSLRNLPAASEWLNRILFNENALFRGQARNPEALKKIYTAWNEEVQRAVPANRLLVFEVRDGWQPLCSFLNVPVPETPFPRSNDSKSFQKNSMKRLLKGDV